MCSKARLVPLVLSCNFGRSLTDMVFVLEWPAYELCIVVGDTKFFTLPRCLTATGVSDHDLLYSKKDKEAPASAVPFGSQPPEATPGLTFGGGSSGVGDSQRPQGPKHSSAIKKTATQGGVVAACPLSVSAIALNCKLCSNAGSCYGLGSLNG